MDSLAHVERSSDNEHLDDPVILAHMCRLRFGIGAVHSDSGGGLESESGYSTKASDTGAETVQGQVKNSFAGWGGWGHPSPPKWGGGAPVTEQYYGGESLL